MIDRTVQPEGWPRPTGYANGVSATGRLVFVAGQVGWDPATERVVSDDLAQQVERALRNIAAVLDAADAGPHDVVRMTWYLTDRARYLAEREAVGRAYRSVFGKHFPAMSVVEVAGLIEDGALVEIEATAVVPEVGRAEPNPPEPSGESGS